MGARTEALGHWVEQISTNREQIRAWVKRVFTGQRISTVALLSTTIAILAALLFSLYKAVQSNTIVGISPYLSSLNW